MLFAVLGVASALIFIAGDIPYLIDAVRAKIKPHRVTWGVVALLNTIGFANQYASGATNSLWLFGAGAALTGSIFLTSLKNGVGGHTKMDIYAIIGCSLGLILWAIFKTPLFSIFANIAVAIIALMPTFAKAKKAPQTETKIAWSAGTLSALLATISVGKLDWRLLLIPGVSVILQGYMVYILYFQVRSSQRDQSHAH